MNIGPSVDTLAQVGQGKYQDLTIGFSELSQNIELQPFGFRECGNLTDCSECPQLVRNTERKVQTVFQYGSPMAVTCGTTEEQPLVYMRFIPINH